MEVNFEVVSLTTENSEKNKVDRGETVPVRLPQRFMNSTSSGQIMLRPRILGRLYYYGGIHQDRNY